MPIETALREKQRLTRAALVSGARKRTAAGGLASFTVQELSDEVGISRRSFFNYFKSKESAVLGIENGVDEEHLEAFLAARGVERDRRRDLVEDLYDLVLDHFTTLGPRPSELAELIAAFNSEPKLLSVFLESGQTEQRRFVTLLAERDDSVDLESAEVALVVLEALVRLSVDAFFKQAGDDARLPFSEILQSRIVAARALFPAPGVSAHAAHPTTELVTVS